MIRKFILAALLLCAPTVWAQGTISAMTAASALSGTELFECVQSGSKKCTAAQIKTFTSASPTLVTPALGVATATSINKVTITAPTTGATLTIPDGVTLNAGAGGTLGALSFITPGTNVATALGVAVGSDGAFITRGGNAGTPSALVCTNCTGTAAGLTAGAVTTNANLSGDVTSSGNTTTLATVNSNVGSFTNSSITVNGKGLITAASSGAAGAILGANTFTALQTITQATANTAALVASGHSLTGSNNTTGYSFTSTLNTTGATYDVFKIASTVTATGAGTNLFAVYGGAAGATSYLKVASSGLITSGATGQHYSSGLSSTPGWGSAVGGQFDIYSGGASIARYTETYIDSTSGSQFAMSKSSVIGLTATTTAAAIDTIWSRGGAATWQQGAANAASPVAQTLQAQGSRSGTDTDVAGANYTIRCGAGTGAASPCSTIFQTYVPVASGTGAQTATTTLTLNNATTTATGSFILATSATPAAADACTAGRIVWGADYIYVCTASGAWKRAAITGGY